MNTTDATILITGATSGIGKAGALAIGRLGWNVLVHARSEARGKPVLEELRRDAPDANFELVTGDLASLTQVRGLAEQVKNRTQRLDVLWNNAGLTINERKRSTDGWELQMAVNHLAPFLLTHELLPLVESARGRIITTSSGSYIFGKFNWDDWMDDNTAYSGFRTYGKTKLANILFTIELARRYGEKGITAHCFHPGMIRTDFYGEAKAEGRSGLSGWLQSLFWKDAATGADTGIFLSVDPYAKESNGKFWIKRKVQKVNRSVNAANAARLWELSEKATC